MIDHYNAFISYKHSPEDIKVAETVQKELERFHIPSKIRKQTGIKRISRIFRDKNELPITSDLSETISNALEHSDYLIVICSTKTKESIWVQREIEFFLKNHSIRQVLTVLVNGEPEDVIPKILIENTEPLSCDYRMPIRKANKIELPRLASALIGCSYDELMNRRKQYKMQRAALGISAAFFIMFAFSIYMLYSRNKIHENYIEALRNQSKYLSNESENMLKNEQRITALQLALAALPKDEDDDRPVTPEAINALSKATLAYETENPYDIYNQWNYKTDNSIHSIDISPNGATLAALDMEGQLYLWNTIDHSLILSTDREENVFFGFKYLSYDKLLAWDSSTAFLYSTDTGEVIWEIEPEDYSFSYDGPLVSENNLYMYTGFDSFAKIDANTGKSIDVINIEGLSDFDYINSAALSPDETKIALAVTGGTMSQYRLGILDLKSGKTTLDDWGNEYIDNLYWFDKDKLIYSSMEDVAMSSSKYDETYLLKEDKSTLICVDIDDLSEVWKNDFSSNNVSLNSKFVYIPKNDTICFYRGNIAGIYNAETGEELYKHDVNSPIINAVDVDNDGLPTYFTTDGSIAMPYKNEDSNQLALRKYFTNDIKTLLISDGYYVNQYDSNEIIYYQSDVSDTNWTPLSDTVITDLYGALINDDLLAISSGDGDDTILTCYILKDGFKEVQIRIEDKHSYECDIKGYYNGKVYAVTSENEKITLLKADAATGKIEEKELPGSFIEPDYISDIDDGKLIYSYGSDDGIDCIAVYDADTDSVTSHEITEDLGPSLSASHYCKGQHLVYVPNCNIDIIFDTKSYEATLVDHPENWSNTDLISSNESGDYFAISNGTSVYVIDRKGEPVYEIKSTGVPVTGMAFYQNDKSQDEDQLLIVRNDGILYRYSLLDGTYINSSEINYTSTFNDECFFDFDYESHILYVQNGTTLEMIDTTTWSEITRINNCLGHHVPTDRFFTFSTSDLTNYRIGYFERYSTEELIQKAKDMLGDAELTDEQKAKYGIEDD